MHMDRIQHTPPRARTYTWPFPIGDGTQLEKIWSGPEPQTCAEAEQVSANQVDRRLLSDGPFVQYKVGDSTYQGCYRLSKNANDPASVEDVLIKKHTDDKTMDNEVGID